MIPGTYNLSVTEGSTNVLSFVISGITTATGYTAAIDIRTGDADDGNREREQGSEPCRRRRGAKGYRIAADPRDA